MFPVVALSLLSACTDSFVSSDGFTEGLLGYSLLPFDNETKVPDPEIDSCKDRCENPFSPTANGVGMWSAKCCDINFLSDDDEDLLKQNDNKSCSISLEVDSILNTDTGSEDQVAFLYITGNLKGYELYYGDGLETSKNTYFGYLSTNIPFIFAGFDVPEALGLEHSLAILLLNEPQCNIKVTDDYGEKFGRNFTDWLCVSAVLFLVELDEQPDCKLNDLALAFAGDDDEILTAEVPTECRGYIPAAIATLGNFKRKD